MAIKMYLEGLGFRAVGRLLGVSHQTVYKWVKQLGEQHQVTTNTNQAIDVVELDEIHSDTKHKKNYCWIWIAIDRHTKHILGFVCGKRDTKTFMKLYNTLNPNNITLFCSDYWKSYQEVIPKSKHYKARKKLLP